jgi:hypothetical protein
MESNLTDIITLETRTGPVRINKNILLKNSYFGSILTNNINHYYVDIDKEILLELIAYMESGFFRTKIFNDNYLYFALKKFNIQCKREDFYTTAPHLNENNRNELEKSNASNISNLSNSLNEKNNSFTVVQLPMSNTMCDKHLIICGFYGSPFLVWLKNVIDQYKISVVIHELKSDTNNFQLNMEQFNCQSLNKYILIFCHNVLASPMWMEYDKMIPKNKFQNIIHVAFLKEDRLNGYFHWPRTNNQTLSQFQILVNKDDCPVNLCVENESKKQQLDSLKNYLLALIRCM